MIDIVFYVSICFILFAYFGYPLILVCLPKRYDSSTVMNGYNPDTTVLIAACNEEAVISNTIRSLLKNDYPINNLEIIVCSDASTDNTDNIVKSFNIENIKLCRMEKRSGKFEAQKKALKHARGEIIILADANGTFDSSAIRKLIGHFQNPSVGSTVGRKIINETGTASGEGEGLYWRYEAKLRHLESQIGASWVGCEGGITAIRKNLLSFDYPSWIAQDYALCCKIYEKGFRNKYEPGAIVYEQTSGDIHEEFRRKIRVIIRGIQAFIAFRYLLNPFKHKMFSFQNIMHRLLRWIIPFFLVILLMTSGLSESIVLKGMFAIQSVFYCTAAISAIMFYKNRKISNIFLSIPLYFTSMNAAALVSWFCLFRRIQMWKRTERH